MAALVQAYPQQSSTVTMLQTRPASASGMLQSTQAQAGQQHGGSQQQKRNSFYGTSGAYRGVSGPIQPYAFTSTPSLTPSAQWQQFRASSTPAVPTIQTFENARSRHPASSSMTNLPSTSAMGYPAGGGSRDDSALPGARRVTPTPRPQSAYMAGSAAQVSFAQATPTKTSPERYRRPVPRATDSTSVPQSQMQSSAPPSGSGMATIGHLYNNGRNVPDPRNRSRTPAFASRPTSFYASMPGSAADDIQLYRHQAQQDEVKRFRRRSMPTLDSADYPKPLTPHIFKQPGDSTRLEQLAAPKNPDKDIRSARIVAVNGAADTTMHARNGSSESVVSARSSNSRPSSVSSAPLLRTM